jgi:Inner membrane protein YgaP-like, transmembrane domain
LAVIILRLRNKEVKKMSVERMVLAFAGSFILISLIFSELFSPYWLLFTAFVGANLLQSAFTGFCPLAKVLKAFGVKPSSETFRY